MEWRQQTSVSCEEAFNEAQRWIQEVTGKSFGSNDFRAALENGVLLCDLINCLKPGVIKRVNRLSTPIAGLDNVNVFLKACGKVGLNVSQLFHPGDLQDLSTRATLRQDESDRRLKNVLVTIYWLGRKAHLDAFYTGPQLNFKAFEGLLGLALSKALDEGWYPEREECRGLRPSYGSAKSVDNIDSQDFRTLRPNSEGCGSDAEAEQVYKMETTKQNRGKGFIPPPPPRRKQGREEMGSPLSRTYQIQVRPERPVQVNPGWIWSKSLSDIPMVYPVRKVPDGNTIYALDHKECGLENKRKCSVAAKDSEAQWHDDLMKWKNRRRSTKSDLRKKSQEWDQVINQMAIGAMNRFEKKEVQGRLPRDQQSPRRHYASPRPYSTSPPSKSPSCNLRPHTRALLACSYSTEAPFSPTSPLGTYNSACASGSSFAARPASNGNILGEKTYAASLASDGARVTTPSLDFPFSSQTQVKAQCSPAPLQPTTPLAGVAVLEDTSQRVCQKSSVEPAVEQGAGQQVAGVYKYLSRTGSWSGSASLPRGYRRSEGSSRLSSAITPRPFGTRQSSVSSLQRPYSVDDNEGRLLKSEKEEPFSPTTKSSLKRQNATAHLKGQHPASIKPEEANQAKQSGTAQTGEVKGATLSSKTNAYNYQPYSQTKLVPRPYANPQSHPTKGLTLPSHASNDLPKVDHSDMRVSLTLKPNSIPDFGIQTHWDSTGARVEYIQPGSPAELCQLCVDDEIVAVNGVAAAQMNSKQWKDEITSSLRTGNLTMDIRRYGNKDWSTSDGFTQNQPGQSRMTLNLTAAAPVLIGCSDHHANSCTATETTVRKMSKMNGQMDNVVHGKVMHGELADNHKTARSEDCNNFGSKNQKKRAEFFKLKGGSESAISDLKVPSLRPSSSSWSWDHEEDRRRQEKWQEEQERLLQGQYQRDQERLESEWQRAQREAKQELCRNTGQNSFEMPGGGESPASTQIYANGLTNKTRKEPSPDRDELQEAGSKPQSNAQGERHDKNSEHAWAKSWSTPALAGSYKPGSGDERKTRGQSVSNAEKDRQQILEEMKKRTQLLTDNSWIRQRSSSFYKEPIYVGVPMKRYESLDDLDALRLSALSTATFSFPRPHSAAAGYRAPTRNASSRYSTGTMLPQRNEFDSAHYGGVWAATNISEELGLQTTKPEAPL
ncbi:LIM domain only protein 7b isoform X3 [Pungitius pungitius]|uniref:LIM domain only protein 7b isoform X3 n=1 Tax=Pungitius pungitius TaxID=134920 RepID=UPI002E0F1F3D